MSSQELIGLLLFALGGPIYAGTNEIQRNIMAKAVLGL
jgi:alkylation response protein AidB-like acyl-CoA dehydrogenase